MCSKFTPGPWEIVNEHYIESVDHGIAKVHYGQEGTADTHLIVAAPDMYEALKELYGYMEDQFHGDNFQPMLARAYRALQKAKGEEIDPHKHNRHYCDFAKAEDKEEWQHETLRDMRGRDHRAEPEREIRGWLHELRPCEI